MSTSIINAILSELDMKPGSFAKAIGAHPTQIYDLQSGKTKNISLAMADKIIDAFPRFNKSYLLAGEGEMLKDGGQNEERFEMPIGEYREDEIPDKYTTRLVPMASMGGSLIGFEEEGVKREDCERVISPVAGADWAVPVCGDSMEPEYPNGSRVFVKQINPNDFIPWGNVFVLDTTNGLIIKMVKRSDKEDCIKCVSLNPSGRYQPFDVPMRTVRAMYRVLLCISIK